MRKFLLKALCAFIVVIVLMSISARVAIAEQVCTSLVAHYFFTLCCAVKIKRSLGYNPKLRKLEF